MHAGFDGNTYCLFAQFVSDNPFQQRSSSCWVGITTSIMKLDCSEILGAAVYNGIDFVTKMRASFLLRPN